MAIIHTSLTLRGNNVEKGISISNNQIPFNPHWGMTRHNVGLIAATPAPDGNLDNVYVAVTDEEIVLVPCEENNPQRELVLVQEYATGSGAKRWPGFSVEFGDEVRKLSRVSTGGGSGGETWTLVSAPIGWAENIAAQFVNERDEDSQVVAYRPDLAVKVSRSSSEETDDQRSFEGHSGGDNNTAMAEVLRKAGLA